MGHEPVVTGYEVRPPKYPEGHWLNPVWNVLTAGVQRIVRAPCHFGGTRPFVICDGCGRRAVKLYLEGPSLCCRTCADLTYASQRERELDRAIRRSAKIKRRIGGHGALLEPFPDAPPMKVCTRFVDTGEPDYKQKLGDCVSRGDFEAKG